MSKTKTYEQKQDELEAIVAKLESGNVPLDEMIALYEQGEALYRECAETLDAYEKRLESFAKKEND
ncbi:MAG: exodeoxyribonuclease VII small subunit [Clostridia bacterium]|jgi:exodeoxyribonuclease VII small subunit|nr:exodeoxyribonuclease VII small subunit [Clostridia bacterium]MBR0436721.1 exodeoxyribonuclease VII small subunit [Clostridia bacterium]MBR3129842.1 exodeoxyribonuclease VII small subunit [Clostridia bacterium]